MSEPLKHLTSWEEEFLKYANSKDCLIECYESVTSTMEVARNSLKSRTSEGDALILARRQLSGRGRRGNQWESTHDGFYGTFLFCTKNDASTLEGLSLMVGSVLVAVCKEWNIKSCLKWPNDLLTLEEKKLGGILIELLATNDHRVGVLIGIGLNLGPVPVAIEGATSLFEQNREHFSAVKVAATVYPALLAAFRTFEKDGFAAFKETWLKNALWLGEELQGTRGGAEVCGVFTGIDEKGRLVLKGAGESITLSSGEISLIRRRSSH